MTTPGSTSGGLFLYINRFRRKAMPDEDFKYFSNASALVLLGKEQNLLNFQGLNLVLCLLAPLLCEMSRAFKFEAIPTYVCLGEPMLRRMYTKYISVSYIDEPVLRSSSFGGPFFASGYKRL